MSENLKLADEFLPPIPQLPLTLLKGYDDGSAKPIPYMWTVMDAAGMHAFAPCKLIDEALPRQIATLEYLLKATNAHAALISALELMLATSVVQTERGETRINPSAEAVWTARKALEDAK